MDEPFVGVDAATEAAIIEILRELQQQGKTLIVVHHDLTTAPDYFDRILLLNMRVVAYGKTQEVFTFKIFKMPMVGAKHPLGSRTERAQKKAEGDTPDDIHL